VPFKVLRQGLSSWLVVSQLSIDDILTPPSERLKRSDNICEQIPAQLDPGVYFPTRFLTTMWRLINALAATFFHKSVMCLSSKAINVTPADQDDLEYNL
jgi:hypothetical protein